MSEPRPANEVVVLTAEQIHGGIRARLAALASPDGKVDIQKGRAQLLDWRDQLFDLNTRLAALLGQPNNVRKGAVAPANAPLTDLAEDVAAGIERTAALTAAVQHANALRLSLPSGPTPREQLAAFVRDHAIFFADNADYRDEAEASRTLDRLATLMKASDAFLRVVGYTDEKGGQQRNTSLSQQRADKVADELAQRGINRQRMVAVGRLNSIDLSPSIGTSSPNRRVELEIGFIGEAGP